MNGFSGKASWSVPFCFLETVPDAKETSGGRSRVIATVDYAGTTREEDLQINQRPIEVLIVEDNEADVHLTVTALRDATIANEIHVVGDGEQAVGFLKREGAYAGAPRPDLILLDLNLPKKDGFTLLAEMKADPELRTVPVIVVSGGDRESDIAQAYDLQIVAYRVKPRMSTTTSRQSER